MDEHPEQEETFATGDEPSPPLAVALSNEYTSSPTGADNRGKKDQLKDSARRLGSRFQDYGTTKAIKLADGPEASRPSIQDRLFAK